MRKMLIATVSAMALFSLGAVAQDATGTDTQAPAATLPAEGDAATGTVAQGEGATTETPPPADAAGTVAEGEAAPAPDVAAPDAAAPDATATTEAAPAVEEPVVEEEPVDTAAAPPANVMPDTHQSAEAVIGSNIMSPDGDEIGEISDLIFKQDDKTIEMVVVDVGGFLGMGAKPVAIPFADLTYEEGDGGWLVSMTAEQFDTMPEFQYPEEELPPAATDPGLAPAPATTTQ